MSDMGRLEEIFPHLSSKVRDRFHILYETLSQFNDRLSLVPKSTLVTAAQEHFADAVGGIQLIQKLAPLASPVYDFGSGGGFPGLILSILEPDVPVFLVERDSRKS